MEQMRFSQPTIRTLPVSAIKSWHSPRTIHCLPHIMQGILPRLELVGKIELRRQ
jgi:hypothetical protein